MCARCRAGHANNVSASSLHAFPRFCTRTFVPSNHRPASLSSSKMDRHCGCGQCVRKNTHMHQHTHRHTCTYTDGGCGYDADDDDGNHSLVHMHARTLAQDDFVASCGSDSLRRHLSGIRFCRDPPALDLHDTVDALSAESILWTGKDLPM